MILMLPISPCSLAALVAVGWQKRAVREQVAHILGVTWRMLFCRADKSPFRGRQNTRLLWGSVLSKHITHRDIWKHIKSCVIRGHKVNRSVIHPVFTVDPLYFIYEIIYYSNWSTGNNKVNWHRGQSQRDPNNIWGHAGHRLGPGHSWLMQLGLSGKWLSKQGPEWLPLTGTRALSLLIHSKEPQSNTQRHTVTSNNTGQSGGTRNESHWPSRKTDASLLIRFGHRKQWGLTVGLEWWPQSNFSGVQHCRRQE